jgi:hypothetical protein
MHIYYVRNYLNQFHRKRIYKFERNKQNHIPASRQTREYSTHQKTKRKTTFIPFRTTISHFTHTEQKCTLRTSKRHFQSNLNNHRNPKFGITSNIRKTSRIKNKTLKWRRIQITMQCIFLRLSSVYTGYGLFDYTTRCLMTSCLRYI